MTSPEETNLRINLFSWPEGYRAMSAVDDALLAAGVDVKLHTLVVLRVSQMNGCAYCIDMHSKDARALGESEQRLYALDAWHETTFFSERERAAVVHHEMNDINGELLLFFRWTDNLIHSWDLARAIGADEKLDHELVERCLESVRPFADFLGASGRFAAQVEVASDANSQDQLLALHGRTP